MYYTASQAGQHWCPFAQVPAGIGSHPTFGREYPMPEGPTINRCAEGTRSGRQFPGSTSCLGPKCAAWRWAPGQGVDATGQVEQRRAAARDGAGEYLPEGSAEPPRHPTFNHPTWTWCPGDEFTPPGWVEPREEALGRQFGFCGMATDPAPPLMQVSLGEPQASSVMNPADHRVVLALGDALRDLAAELRVHNHFNRGGDGPRRDTSGG